MQLLHERNAKNVNFYNFFTIKITINPQFFTNFKNLELQNVRQYCRLHWCKFQQNWTKIATPDTFGVKYPKIQYFHTSL